jgi:arsenate reductase (glutaredoxin)
MADVTIYHNPNCGSSNAALARLGELGVDADVVRYLRQPPDRATLERIVDGLEDPVEDLVRKDKRFGELGLDPATYVGDRAAVVELLVREPALLQRPLLIRGGRAIIGRPTSRVDDFVRS